MHLHLVQPFTGTVFYLEIRPAERFGKWQNAEIISHQLSHSGNNKAKWLKEISVRSVGDREISTKAASWFVGEKKPPYCAAGSCAEASGKIQIAN